MVIKHEATQEIYSPKITRKPPKILEDHKHVHATNPYIKKYIFININLLRESMREREEREKNEGEICWREKLVGK